MTIMLRFVILKLFETFKIFLNIFEMHNVVFLKTGISCHAAKLGFMLMIIRIYIT